MAEIKLKPYPFCGSDKLKFDYKSQCTDPENKIRKVTASIRCNKCHARGATYSNYIANRDDDFVKKVASLAWNQRKKEDDS